MSARRASRVLECTPAEARVRRGQARAFLDVADIISLEEADVAEAHVAAALAVLAAIAAADAICGLRLGRWSRGSDHQQAVALLATVDLEDRALVGKFRRVLAAKDSAHYSPHLVSRSAAVKLVQQAGSLVEFAERL